MRDFSVLNSDQIHTVKYFGIMKSGFWHTRYAYTPHADNLKMIPCIYGKLYCIVTYHKMTAPANLMMSVETSWYVYNQLHNTYTIRVRRYVPKDTKRYENVYAHKNKSLQSMFTERRCDKRIVTY